MMGVKAIAIASLGALLVAWRRFKVPLSPPFDPVDPVVAAALAELVRWQGVKEGQPLGRELVREYWRVTDGSDHDAVDIPWSAAFISYVVEQGAPGALKLSGAHMTYAHAAKGATEPGKYRALPPTTPVIPGDIVIAGRAGDEPRFSDLGTGKHFKTHGDIVTQVNGDNAKVIGGNVRNDVSRKVIAVDSRGVLQLPDLFTVLRRNRG